MPDLLAARRLTLLGLLFLVAVPLRAAVLEESWFASYVGTSRIGYLHDLREVRQSMGRRVVLTRMESQIALKRMGTRITLSSRAEFEETLGGEAIRFESHNKFAANDYTIRAERVGDTFLVTQESMGGKTETEVPFSPDILFPQALDREIVAHGMKPGAKLELRTFSPDMARPTVMRVQCKDWELTPLLDGKEARLLRFETEQDLLPGITLVEWRDERGELRKTLLPVLGFEIVSYRTDREHALHDPDSVELLISTLVDPGMQIPRPRELTRARYQVRLRSGRPASLNLPEDGQQRVVKRTEEGILLEVRRDEWSQNKQAPPPDLLYTQPSSVLQVRDPLIQKLAQEASGGGSPRKLAEDLTRWVYSSITKKSLSIGLATAAEVARNLEGDCTEHAVLLAALARARGLPSRVAMGLVYTEGVFGYHMWTEVYDQGWHGLDAAFGQTAVDATHIKLAESALAHGFVDEGLASLVQLVANLEIRVVELELGEKVYGGYDSSHTGSIKEGVYHNPVYRLRVEPPRGWRVLQGRREQEPPSVLVRLQGPDGASAELTARALSYDFKLDDWLARNFPGQKVVDRRTVTVGKLPGVQMVLAGGETRLGLVTFTNRDTLFAVRLQPLDARRQGVLDRIRNGIDFKD